MKTTTAFSLTILSAATLAVIACGKYEKNPVPDIQTLRENGKAQEGYVSKPIATKTEYVPQPTAPVTTTVEAKTVGPDFVTLTIKNGTGSASSAVPTIMFPEGKETKATLTITLLSPTLANKNYKFELVHDGDLSNAVITLKNISSDLMVRTYELSWTPSGYNWDTLDIAAFKKDVNFGVVASGLPADLQAKFNGTFAGMTLSMVVVQNNEKKHREIVAAAARAAALKKANEIAALAQQKANADGAAAAAAKQKADAATTAGNATASAPKSTDMASNKQTPTTPSTTASTPESKQ